MKFKNFLKIYLSALLLLFILERFDIINLTFLAGIALAGIVFSTIAVYYVFGKQEYLNLFLLSAVFFASLEFLIIELFEVNNLNAPLTGTVIFIAGLSILMLWFDDLKKYYYLLGGIIISIAGWYLIKAGLRFPFEFMFIPERFGIFDLFPILLIGIGIYYLLRKR